MAQVSTPPYKLRKLEIPAEALLNALMCNFLVSAGSDVGKHFFQETHLMLYCPSSIPGGVWSHFSNSVGIFSILPLQSSKVISQSGNFPHTKQ